MSARDLINLGTAPDSGTGDSARKGGEKINNLFADIYANLGDNPIENDPSKPYYGYRRNFKEFEYKVGEIHAAGSYTNVRFKTPLVNGTAADSDRLYTPNVGFGVTSATSTSWRSVDASGVPAIFRDSEWYFMSRGEAINIDVAEVQTNRNINVVLPLAVEGDVCIIRDYKRSLVGKTMSIWTTPYEFGSSAQVTEWISNTTGTTTLPDSDAMHISQPDGDVRNCSYKAVNRDLGSFKLRQPFNVVTLGAPKTNSHVSAIRWSTPGIILKFTYAGPKHGWIYSEENVQTSADVSITDFRDKFKTQDWIKWTAPNITVSSGTGSTIVLNNGWYILPVVDTQKSATDASQWRDITPSSTTPTFRVYKAAGDSDNDPIVLNSVKAFLTNGINNRNGVTGWTAHQLRRAKLVMNLDSDSAPSSSTIPGVGLRDVSADDFYREITVSSFVDTKGDIILISREPFSGFVSLLAPDRTTSG